MEFIKNYSKNATTPPKYKVGILFMFLTALGLAVLLIIGGGTLAYLIESSEYRQLGNKAHEIAIKVDSLIYQNKTTGAALCLGQTDNLMKKVASGQLIMDPKI